MLNVNVEYDSIPETIKVEESERSRSRRRAFLLLAGVLFATGALAVAWHAQVAVQHESSGLDLNHNLKVKKLQLNLFKEQQDEVIMKTGADIVGGSLVSSITPYTFMVSTQKVQGQHWCGGTVLDPYWVLSAAHCGLTSSGFVAGGNVYPAMGMNIAQVYQNPQYHQTTPAPNGATGWDEKYDYILFRMQVPIPMSSIVAPVPFLYGYEVASGTHGTILGWGATAPHAPGSHQLKQASVKTQPCGTGWWIQPNEVCLGDVNGMTCPGDSGGPFVISQASKWGLYGVASGANCATHATYAGLPYLTVSDASNWMYQTIMESHQYSILPVTRMSNGQCQNKDYRNRVTTVSCPDTNTLKCGETRRGILNSGETKTYSFNSGSNPIPMLIVSTCSSATTMDTVIDLADQSGNTIHHYDDTGTCGHHSYREFIEFGTVGGSTSPIASNTAYQLKVSGYGQAGGVFQVSAICSQGVLTCGSTVTGSLATNEKKFHTFAMTSASQSVTISTCHPATNFDTVVMLFDADGTTLIQEYDDTNSNGHCSTAYRENIVFAPGGKLVSGFTYQIAVGGYKSMTGNSAAGSYQLSVNCA